MATNILIAEVAIVQVGYLRFEGLLLETGDFGVGFPQLAEMNLVPPNRSLKQLESLLGIRFQSHQKAKTPLNPKAINVISLGEFTSVVVASADRGVGGAIAIRNSLVGLSLHQLFCDAFKIRLESEDRQAWLIERQDSKDAFWEIGKAIKAYKERHPELSSDRKQWLYSNVQNNINRGLFGKAAKTIREELGVKNLLRDSYGRKSLRRIDHIQSLAASLIEEEDIDPCLAVQQALDSFKYKSIGYCE